MNRKLVLFALLLAGCQSADETAEEMGLTYPATRKDQTADEYFGIKVDDPYQWLENDTSVETAAWVKAQNAVTFDYLKKIPYRDKIARRYEEIFNYPKVANPRKVGAYFIIEKNNGLQNQNVVYYREGKEGEEKVLIDPNTLSADGTVSISLMGASRDDRYVAYLWQEAGSDWARIKVRELATNTDLPDELNWVKFSGASWWKDGFFYSRYPEPTAGTELSGKNEYHSVYYHKLGTPQSEDELIFSDMDHPRRFHSFSVTEDSKYGILTISEGTDNFETWYKDLEAGGKEFKPLFTGFTNKSTVVDHRDGRFYVHTNVNAPMYRFVEVDLAKPAVDNWKDIVPERDYLLQGVSRGGGYFFADYLKNATTKIYRIDYQGQGETEIALPGLGSAGGFWGKKEEMELYYSYTSFTYPTTIFKYDVATGSSEVFYKPDLKFDPAQFEEKQVFYKSKDGTDVSMFIVHKKGLALDGQNPTLLYGYGGFNIPLGPGFSVSNIILLENGGVYALANLRGGGEYGEEWHEAGMKMKKQNVFDDFIAAGEYLISEGYTSPQKLGIHGGSNGGLLVGACMTQRPDLFAVAMPAVGVLDMLKFQKFTIGYAWVDEYGSSEESEEMFNYLKSYSPLHNLRPQVQYPATMITTADHDDRVVPAHSFKFAATLQEMHTGPTPVIIRIEEKAGHGAGKPTSKVIEEQADKWAFFFWNTGVKELYNTAEQDQS